MNGPPHIRPWVVWGGALGEGLTIGVLQNGQRSVAVLVVGELVVVQTLVELVGTDQSRRPGRRICSHESRVRGREPRRGGGAEPKPLAGLTDQRLPLDGGQLDDVPLRGDGLGRELVGDPDRGLEVQLALEHPWRGPRGQR